MQKLRIAYAGTPDFAVPALQSLIHSPHEVIAVITQPDRKSGRGRKITQSAVKIYASSENVQILQPENINTSDTIVALKAMKLDIMVVAAYGQIFTKELLNLPTLGCVNIHASLLPKWRGASPIQHAILSGDQKSGVTIMQMCQEMDAGDIWLQESCDIGIYETAQSLHDKLSVLGGDIILKAINSIADGGDEPTPQDDHLVSHCSKLKKDHGQIQWQESASTIERKVRAFFPWPGTYTFFNSRRLRILCVDKLTAKDNSKEPGTVVNCSSEGILVATGDGAILIKELVPEGGKKIHASDFANSNQLVNETLG